MDCILLSHEGNVLYHQYQPNCSVCIYLYVPTYESIVSMYLYLFRDAALDEFRDWNEQDQIDFVKQLLLTMHHHQHGQDYIHFIRSVTFLLTLMSVC